MKLFTQMFSLRKKGTGNVRRKKKVVSVIQRAPWFKALQVIVIASSVVVLTGFIAMQFNQKMTVTSWKIDAPKHIEEAIAAYFKHQKNLDFWHTRASQVKEDLMLSIPDIQHIEVSRVLPDGLLIKATARQPIALWENITEEVGKEVMLVDERGVAY
ncbi:MAG: hypothetical protein Q9N02_00765, partial [Ghiorsea sp.]|nr:hypothetical protein [Ghiorsea sp.]